MLYKMMIRVRLFYMLRKKTSKSYQAPVLETVPGEANVGRKEANASPPAIELHLRVFD